MKRFFILLIAFIAMVAFINGAVAQVKKAELPAPAVEKASPVSPAPAAEKAKAVKPKAVKIQKASGTVAAYDAAAKTLKVTVKKNEMEFSVADDAKI